MIKRGSIISIILMVLTLSSGFALEQVTLEEVILEAKANNSNVLILDEQIKYASWLTTETKAVAEDLMDDLFNAPSDQRYGLAQKVYIEPLRASFQSKNLNLEKISLLKQLESQATGAYFELLDSEEALLQAKYDVTVAQKDEAAKKLMFEMGRVAKIDYDKAVFTREQMERSLTAYERSIELSYIKLNEIMSRSPYDRYDLVKPALTVDLPVIEDIPEAVENYRLNSLEFIKQLEALDLAEEVYEITSNFSTDRSTRMQADRDREMESFKLDAAKRSADYEFRIEYNNLLNQYDTFVSAYGRYSISVKTYEIAKLKYNRGMITAVEFLKEASTHESIRRERQAALHSFNTAKTSFITKFEIYND